MLTDDPPPPSCPLAPEGGSTVWLVTLDPWCSCLSLRERGWTVRGNLSAGRASRAGARGCVCPAHLSGPCSPSPCLMDTVGFARGLWGPAPFVDFLFCFVLLLVACFRCSFLKYTWDGSERTWCDVSARHPKVHCTRVGAETSSCPLVCCSAVLIRSASPDRARVKRFTGSVLHPPFPSSFSSGLVVVFISFPNEPFAMQLKCAGHVQDEGGPLNAVMHWLGSGRWDPVWERRVRARRGWLLTLCSRSLRSGWERRVHPGTWKYRRYHKRIHWWISYVVSQAPALKYCLKFIWR